MKLAFFDTKPYDKPGFDEHIAGTDIEIKYFETRLGEDTVQLAKGFDDVCVFVNDTVNEKVVNELYDLGVRVIALRCAGFNNVDTKACFGKLHVFRVSAYSPYAVAEHAMALLLTVNRHTNKAYIRTRDFNFSLSGLTGFDLHGKTVGVIGTGKIGRIFAGICKGFGMRVLAYDKFPNPESGLDYVELSELLEQADVISLHCPLTDETRHMIDADAINQYLDSDQFTVELSDPTSTRQIVLNTSSDILSEKDVRIALQHATNKQNISDGIFYGLEKPADTLFASTVPYCDIELEPYVYDLELAGQILDEAGWKMGSGNVREKDGQPLNIDLLYNSDSVTEKSIAEYLQSEYQSIGVSLNIHGEEEQSYRDNMKAGNFDMVFNICWGTPYDPQSSLAAMRAPVYGDYAAQLGLDDKAEIDDAITEILITTDENRRQELYTYVLTHLHEDAVYIPLTYECNKAIYRSDMKGFHFTQTQYEVPFQDFSF